MQKPCGINKAPNFSSKICLDVVKQFFFIISTHYNTDIWLLVYEMSGMHDYALRGNKHFSELSQNCIMNNLQNHNNMV